MQGITLCIACQQRDVRLGHAAICCGVYNGRKVPQVLQPPVHRFGRVVLVIRELERGAGHAHTHTHTHTTHTYTHTHKQTNRVSMSVAAAHRWAGRKTGRHLGE